MESTPGDQDNILYVAEVRAARTVVHARVAGVLYRCAGKVSLRILDVEALGPGVIGQQAEAGREAMLDGGDEAVVVGHTIVVDQV